MVDDASADGEHGFSKALEGREGPAAARGPAAGGRVLCGTCCSAHLGQGPQLRPRILPGVEFEREGVSAPVARAGGRGLGVVRGAPRLAEVAGVRVRRVPAPLPCTACCPARSPHPVPDPVTPTPPGSHRRRGGGRTWKRPARRVSPAPPHWFLPAKLVAPDFPASGAYLCRSF